MVAEQLADDRQPQRRAGANRGEAMVQIMKADATEAGNRDSHRKGRRHLPRVTRLSKPYDHRLVLDHIQRLLAARDRNDRT
jgi:hypothetical protein